MTNLTDYQAPSTKRKRTPSLPESQRSFDCNGLVGMIAATLTSSTVKQTVTIQITPELSPISLQLLALFAALGGVNIPSLLIERFLTRQMRGSRSAHIASANGFGPESFAQLRGLREEAELTNHLEELLSGSWVTVKNYHDPSIVTYSILDAAKKHVVRLMRGKGFNYWKLFALRFVCYAFPCDPWEEK